MIAVTKDAAWSARLGRLASGGGWPFAAFESLPRDARSGPVEAALAVVDRSEAGASLARAVAALRSAFPGARIVLACTDAELGADAVAQGLSSGVDEVVAKSWSDARLAAKLSDLRDAAFAAAVKISADGTLKAELRSRRVYGLARKRWTEIPMPAAEFALLFGLMAFEGEPLSRERLLATLRLAAGKEVEAETVSRRVHALRRALAPWKFSVESVRGGFYRLVSSRRRSTT